MTDLLLTFAAAFAGANWGIFVGGLMLRRHHEREDARHRDRARRLADLAAARDVAVLAAGDAATNEVLLWVMTRARVGVPCPLRDARLARDAAIAAYHAAYREAT